MTARVTDVRAEQPIEGDRRATAFDGTVFVPVKIEHAAYVYEGDFYRISTLFAPDGTNCSLRSNGRNDDWLDDWLDDWPAAPVWFDVVAETIRREVEL